MYHLKLNKGLSYYGMGGKIKATRQEPDFYTEDEATAALAVASGYFTSMGEVSGPEEGDKELLTGHLDPEQLEGMGLKALKTLAADMGIDTKGLDKPKIIAAITAVDVEAGTEHGDGEGEADYGEDGGETAGEQE